MNFLKELQALLRSESNIPVDPYAEIAREQTDLFKIIQKNNSELSLQVEEIYDIVKGADENAKEAKAAVRREKLLLDGLAAMCDLLDNVLLYMQQSEHVSAVEAKRDEIMNSCGIEQLGFLKERLDPRIHTVAAAEYSDAPPEYVIQVLEKGYMHRGKVLRKATVVLSKGVEH